jgi:hypothetical protein
MRSRRRAGSPQGEAVQIVADQVPDPLDGIALSLAQLA